MAIKLADVFLAISADDRGLDQDLNRVEGKTKNWAGGMAGNVAKFAGGIAIAGAAAAGAAIVGLATTGINAFIGFESKMNEVFTLLPGITEDAMGQMNEQVKTFAKEFGVLPEEVVPALYQALSAGVPPDNVFDFLAVANKAAVGGVAELETAVDGISSVVNAYGNDVIDATKASDLMFTAVRLGKTDFNQLSASLFNVIPTAASLGVEFGDVTAALAAMTAQGTPTSVATTQLRQLLVELSKDGGKASKAFEELSGKSFVDFIAQGGNVQDALVIMERAAEKNNVRLSDMFGSVEAGNAALALTGKGAETFRGNLEEMGNAAGATDAAFQQMDSGIGKTMEKVRASWAVAMLDIGNSLAPLVEAILPSLVGGLQTAIGFLTSIFEVIQLLGTGDFRGGIFGLHEDDPAIDALFQFRDGLMAIFEWVGNLVNFVRGEFIPSMVESTGIFEHFQVFIEDNMPRIQEIIEKVLTAISVFWEAHGETILHIIENVFGTAAEVIGLVMRTILSVITLVLQLLNGEWEDAWNTFLNILEDIWNTIVKVVETKLDTLFSLFSILDWSGAGRSLINGIWEGMQGAWNNVQEWFWNRLDDLRNLLPFSEPKDPSSPLRNLQKSGAAIVEQLQLGIDNARLSIMGPDLSGVSAAAAGGNGRIINVHRGAVEINNGGMGAGDLATSLEEGLKRLLQEIVDA